MNDKMQRRIIMLISALGAFWTPFITSSVNMALPYIGGEFNIGSSLVNWVASSTVLAIAIFVLPMGKVADIWGSKKILLGGAIFLTIATLFCSIAQSITLLLIARVMQGFGCAMIATTVVPIVFSAFPPNERGKALGINVACTYIGLSMGPILGGVIITYTSWRGIFLFTIPLGAVLIGLLSKIIRIEGPLPKGNEKFDVLGAVLYGASIFMIIFGLSNLLAHYGAKYLLGLGLIGATLFVYYDSRIANPIVKVSLFKGNRVLSFSLIASLVNYSSTFAISYLMSLYLQVVLKLEPGYAGLVLLTQPALQALLSPLTGRLSDKVAPQKLASVGMGLIAIGLFAFSFFKEGTTILGIIPLLALVGIGYALFSAPNTNAIMSSVEKRYYGVTSGLIGTARTVGQSLSMSLTALVFSVFLGNMVISERTIPDFMRSFQVSFIILAVLCLFGVFASLARGKVQPNPM